MTYKDKKDVVIYRIRFKFSWFKYYYFKSRFLFRQRLKVCDGFLHSTKSNNICQKGFNSISPVSISIQIKIKVNERKGKSF